jgi:ABC-type amino acid transport substrate-binding protein
MSVDEKSLESATSNMPSRRALLKLGGGVALGAGAWALAACEQSSNTQGTTANAAENSVLDKWVSSKKAKLGVDLTFPPIQFKDSAGKPTGYQMELTEAMMADLGVTPEYVEIPFGQLFAGLVAGRFDIGNLGDDPSEPRAEGTLLELPGLL